MGGTPDPNANNPMNKIAGPAGWLIGIITGVGFIGLLYSNAGHHDGDHGADHGADHAEDHGEAKADGAAEKAADH